MEENIIKSLLEQNAKLIEQNNALTQQTAVIASQLVDVLKAFAERDQHVNVVVNSYNGSKAEAVADNSQKNDASVAMHDVRMGNDNTITPNN